MLLSCFRRVSRESSACKAKDLYRKVGEYVPYIINFPTKKHWKGQSRLDYIDAGLDALIVEVRRLGIRSIALPPLGCGLGGLDWEEVRPRIEQAFAGIPDVRVLLYAPTATPNSITRPTRVAPKMTIGRAVLLGLMEQYMVALMDPFVSLLELHKLMYFMQEAGEPLRLRYAKGIYGPYAENLKNVLTAIDDHFVRGYGDAVDSPSKPIELIPEAAREAETFLGTHPATCAHFRRVADLIEGFETPFGMELLATVHWVAIHEGASDPGSAMHLIYDWNDRKKNLFSEQQIVLAWRVLLSKDWIATDG